MNDQEAAMYNYPCGEPHNCDESRSDGGVKLACGCMLPVVAGTLSPDGQLKLKQWQTQMVPCGRGRINGMRTIVMRDTGSTTCVVKKSLVKPEQMTGSYELCMLIHGIVKRYPTAMVELDTPYFIGKTKVLCMDNPVQDIIIGNIPGASGVQPNLVNTKAKVTPNMVNVTQSLHTGITKDVPEPVNNSEICLNTNTSAIDVDSTTDMDAAVQTRAMVAKKNKPPKPLKVNSVPGLDIGPEELKAKQKADESLKKYRELVDKPIEDGKPQFFEKKGILYRRYFGRRGEDATVQLVVPKELREKVVSLAHDTLLAGHRGHAKTLSRVQQEFHWPGVHEFMTRYVASCDLCQRNVSKGTVSKAPLGKLPLIETPFSVICIDIVGTISPPSEGFRYILTTIDMCTRFPEAVPLKDISTSTVAEAQLNMFSRVGLPNRIHSDRGYQFTSEMMREVYRLLDIRQSTTTPYHAMGNGIVENFNKTIKILLKKVSAEKPKEENLDR